MLRGLVGAFLRVHGWLGVLHFIVFFFNHA